MLYFINDAKLFVTTIFYCPKNVHIFMYPLLLFNNGAKHEKNAYSNECIQFDNNSGLGQLEYFIRILVFSLFGCKVLKLIGVSKRLSMFTVS